MSFQGTGGGEIWATRASAFTAQAASPPSSLPGENSFQSSSNGAALQQTIAEPYTRGAQSFVNSSVSSNRTQYGYLTIGQPTQAIPRIVSVLPGSLSLSSVTHPHIQHLSHPLGFNMSSYVNMTMGHFLQPISGRVSLLPGSLIASSVMYPHMQLASPNLGFNTSHSGFLPLEHFFQPTQASTLVGESNEVCETINSTSSFERGCVKQVDAQDSGQVVKRKRGYMTQKVVTKEIQELLKGTKKTNGKAPSLSSLKKRLRENGYVVGTTTGAPYARFKKLYHEACKSLNLHPPYTKHSVSLEVVKDSAKKETSKQDTKNKTQKPTKSAQKKPNISQEAVTRAIWELINEPGSFFYKTLSQSRVRSRLLDQNYIVGDVLGPAMIRFKNYYTQGCRSLNLQLPKKKTPLNQKVVTEAIQEMAQERGELTHEAPPRTSIQKRLQKDYIFGGHKNEAYMQFRRFYTEGCKSLGLQLSKKELSFYQQKIVAESRKATSSQQASEQSSKVTKVSAKRKFSCVSSGVEKGLT